MTKRIITRLTVTIESIEVTRSSAPFMAVRRVINTTGVEIRDSDLPPSSPVACSRPIARVVPLRKAG